MHSPDNLLLGKSMFTCLPTWSYVSSISPFDTDYKILCAFARCSCALRLGAYRCPRSCALRLGSCRCSRPCRLWGILYWMWSDNKDIYMYHLERDGERQVETDSHIHAHTYLESDRVRNRENRKNVLKYTRNSALYILCVYEYILYMCRAAKRASRRFLRGISLL